MIYGPDAGQHIAFYSRHTMHFIATRFGYDVLAGGAFTIFVRRSTALSRWKRVLLSRSHSRNPRGSRLDWDRRDPRLAPRHPSLTSIDSLNLWKNAARLRDPFVMRPHCGVRERRRRSHV